jgi:hypothetical protein
VVTFCIPQLHHQEVNMLDIRLAFCLHSAGFLLGLIFGLVSLKHQLTFTKLRGIMSQKKKTFQEMTIFVVDSF